jgi:hypothetical protein
MPQAHHFYEAHRSSMEASMRQRLDLVSDLLVAQVGETAVSAVKQDVMREFEVVLEQMPYVGGASSRMTDFFMRLLGFMAIGRVLKERGVSPDAIGEIELESFKRQTLTIPEADRMEAGRQFMSAENRALIREQAARSHQQTYAGDFVYDYVEPGPGETFDFGINYRICGFSNLRPSKAFADIRSTSVPDSRPTICAASIWSERRRLRVGPLIAISVSPANLSLSASDPILSGQAEIDPQSRPMNTRPGPADFMNSAMERTES